jgi:dihydrofolate synthase/folylpolyglutamate synthase
MLHISNFDEANQVLKHYIPSAHTTAPYTLGRMQQLLHAIGNPQNTYKVVHVGGTSGKTSTSYYIASLLTTSGKKVGLTVSPHIDEINERVQINLQPLPEKVFCQQLERFVAIVAETGVKPTYFELLVAFAYWQFAEAGVDYAVIEVGLGGLLDGTNVVTSSDKVCVITDIGLDHTEVLGRTLPEITSQKAGIIRPQNAVFMHEQTTEVMTVVREVCSQQQASLQEIPVGTKSDAPKHLPLFQRRNWQLAEQVYSFVLKRDELDPLSVQQKLQASQAYIPARMEVIKFNGKLIIMDGAHNAQKLSTLFKSIKAKYPKQDIAVMMSLKHTRGIRTKTSLRVLTKYATWLGLTSFTGSQDTPYHSVEPTKLAEYCHMMDFDNWQVIRNPEAAFEALLQRPEPILLITGSFYLLNHIRPLIHGTIAA